LLVGRRKAFLIAVVWEVAMVDRRQQLLDLLQDERDPLVRLVIADELAQELRVLLRHLANTANHAGYSWAAIGKALGVSRAAAHERFSDGHRRATARTRRAR
jgi:hypothetical protein